MVRATTGFVANGAVLTAETRCPGEEGYIVVPWLARTVGRSELYPGAGRRHRGSDTVLTASRPSAARYFKKFFDISGFKQGALMGVIGIFVGILELIGELSRLLSFSFRLFGNVFAGEVLLLVMAFLIPYFASLPFYGLELFVGFIQAAVFMMLAVVFMSMATEGHGGGETPQAHEAARGVPSR